MHVERGEGIMSGRSLLQHLLSGAAALCVTLPLSAQSDALAFHAVAQATISAPPSARDLRILCTREVRARETPIGVNGWFSFLAPSSDSSAWIAAFTVRRMRNAGDAITTQRLFTPLPTGKPTASGTLDWAWIWDRNGDGRADYITYLQNAMGVLPDPLPDSFPAPTRNADGSFQLTQPFLYALIDEATMVFRHYADDDFDGRVDLAMVEEADLDRPMFVRGWVVARASKHDGVVDATWAFRRGVLDTTRVLTPEPDGSYLIPDIPIPGARTQDAAKRLTYGTNILAAINDVGARCARGPVRIRRP
jgi:hypothetical protein